MPERGASRVLLLVVLVACALAAWLFFGGGLDTLGLGAKSDEAGGTSQADLLEGGDGASGGGANDEAIDTTALRTGAGDGTGGRISGQLTWVTDGTPVSGANVHLLGRRGVTLKQMETDASGRISFSDLVPSPRYSVRIFGEGFAEVQIHRVEVRRGETTDLGQLHLGEHVVLRGRVVDPTGRPVASSSVSAHVIRGDLLRRGMLESQIESAYGDILPQAEVQTDPDGWFTISTLDDGRYRLEARAEGYASEYRPDVLVRSARTAAPLTLVLGRSVTARGTVRDDGGKPIAGARVRALRSTGRRMSFSGQFEREETVTDGNGRYELTTLAYGNSYRFTLVAEGHPPMVDFREVEAVKPITKDFVISRGGRIEGVVTEEGSDKPVPGAVVSVSTGEMRAMMGGGRGNGPSTMGSSVVQTDEEGKYVIGPVHAGPIMSLSVKAPGYQAKAFVPWPQPHGLSPVVAGETQTIDVALLRGGRIEGEVVDAGGEAIAGAIVEATSAGRGWGRGGSMWLGTPSATSDAAGKYAIVGVPPGPYRVTVRAAGFAETVSEEQIEITEAGNTETLKVVLSGAGIIEGVVLDPEGEPVAGATVRARSQADPEASGGRRGQWMRRMRERQNPSLSVTDAEGRFRLDGLAPKLKWVAVASATGLVDAESEPARLEVGEVRDVEIALLPGATFAGRVQNEDGRPVAGAQVRIGTLTPEQARRVSLSTWEAQRLLGDATVTDEDGRFSMENVAPGRLIVRVEAEGYVPFFKRNVSIDVGGRVDSYSATLGTGGTLRGRVLGPDKKGIARCGVTASTSGIQQGWRGNQELAPEGESGGDEITPALFAMTDDRGNWEIVNVPKGEYTVYVRWAQGYRTGADDPENASRSGVSVPGAPDIALTLTPAPEGEGMPGRRDR